MGRPRPGPADLLRTALTLAAIGPGLLLGLVELVRHRDRRRAMNRAIALWGRLGTAAAGIRLVVEGERHLEEARPAVFILNHQSGVDPILVCALLRHDFVGVAKAEIRRNPLLGPAFRFAGVVFVDRFDHLKAIRALEPAIDTLHAGLSIALAPEGTRSPGQRVGPLKKGAFRLAMAAKVPIVPIVIRNSGDVLPRGAWVMTPATVQVVVHPPIPTEGWTLSNLDREIEAIQGLYRASLDPARTPSAAG